MAHELLLNQFDHAIQTPADVEKFKQYILELAIMGRLVTQDPNDEPAALLVERIASEHFELLKTGKAQKKNVISTKNDYEIPHELPHGWSWTRLPDIGLVNPRNNALDGLDVSFIPMKLVPTKYGELVSSDIRKWGEIKRGYTHFQENDVAFAKITPCFQNRKSTVLEGLVNGFGAGTTELVVFRGNINFIEPKYVLVFFKSPRFIESGVSRMKGTAGQQRVPNDYYLTVPFPLPPFKEQKRILSKVDELFQQTKELAGRLESADTHRKKFHTAAIHHFIKAKTSKDTEATWHLIRDNFDRLYTEPETIDELKQAILQLSVMGRLVPQDPNDEPAEMLLERIAAVKLAFMAKEKLRRPPVLKVLSSELPYNLPASWAWVRIAHICTVKGGKRVPRGYKLLDDPTPYVYVRVTDMQNGTIDDRNLRYVSDDIYQNLKKYIIEKNDLYLVIVGATIGKHGTVPAEFHRMLLTENAVRLTPHCIERRFLDYAIGSQTIQHQFFGKTLRMAQPKLAIKRINTTLFPLPPLNEQKRIVAKADELFEQTEELANQLDVAEKTRSLLLDSVLSQAVP